MPAKRDELARDDIGGAGFDDRVLVGEAGRRLRQQGCELGVCPERRHIEAIDTQLLQHVDVPFQIKFADAVVRDRQRLGARISQEIEIVSLDCDQLRPIGVDDAHWNAERFCLFDGFVPRDDPAVAIDDHGAAGAILAKGPRERSPPAVGSPIRVTRIGCEVGETTNRREGRPGDGLRHGTTSGTWGEAVSHHGGGDGDDEVAHDKDWTAGWVRRRSLAAPQF